METKFTKSPWRIQHGGGHAKARIICEEPFHNNGRERNAEGISSASYSSTVCELTGDLELPTPRANAVLICAAPALFAALEALCGAVQMLDVTAEEAAAIEPLIAEAQGALKKAVTP